MSHIVSHLTFQSRKSSTMTLPAVVLIVGAGPRVGSAIARKFASQGCKVAVASRSVTDGALSPEGYLQVQVDLSQPSLVPRVFEVVTNQLGAPPSVVIYNGTPGVDTPNC